MVNKILHLTLILIIAAAVGGFFIGSSPGSKAADTPTAEPDAQQADIQQAVVRNPLTPVLESNGDVLLYDFEEPDEVGRFCYGNVNVFVENAEEISRTGENSVAATYYVGSDRQGKRILFYTLFHPAHGRMNNWSPFAEFQASIYNLEEFTVNLDVEYSDGVTSVWRRYSLPPGVWSRIRQPLSDLSDNGLNTSNMKRISWTELDTDIQDINTLYFDDIRLTGADYSRAESVVQAAWEGFEHWSMEEGGDVKAEYIPTIHTDDSRISDIQEKYNCGHIDGYVVTDVAVIGGGMAGSSAAIASGRMGVETLLIEQYGFLGGMATAALVSPWMPNWTAGRDLSKGIFMDIFQELKNKGMAERDNLRPGLIWFDKEGLKYVLNELVVDSGSKMMLHSWAEMPLVIDGKVEGVIVDNKSGRLAILAKVVIDSTGDGDMAAGAGAPYEIGRGYDNNTQATTLFFRMGGVNTVTAFADQGARLQRAGGQVTAEFMYNDIFKNAVANGTFPADIPISTVYFERTMNDGVVSINATRAFEVDATNVNDMTYASVETRRQALFLANFMKENIPGFEHAYLQETGTQIGVRESRRILGEYQLTGRDVLHNARFPDVIAMGSFGIDIHCADYTGCGVVGLSLDEGASYDIPYRCLVPLEVDNLLLAGRCISVSHVALGSVRIQAICSATGHAAGVAAALCVQYGTTPRELEYPLLHDALLAQNAELGSATRMAGF